MKTLLLVIAFVVSLASLAPVPAVAAEPYAGYGDEPTQSDHIGEKEYSPYLSIGYPQRVFWGDTHVHTSYSTDAGMIGNRLGPDEAYRFARGEIVAAIRWPHPCGPYPCCTGRRRPPGGDGQDI